MILPWIRTRGHCVSYKFLINIQNYFKTTSMALSVYRYEISPLGLIISTWEYQHFTKGPSFPFTHLDYFNFYIKKELWVQVLSYLTELCRSWFSGIKNLKPYLGSKAVFWG